MKKQDESKETVATPKPRGRWKAGESGNPSGRKPGTGKVAKIRAAIEKRVPELLDRLMLQALSGDVAAARLLLERTVAPLKPVELAQAIELSGGTLACQGRAVMSAASEGKLAPSQAALLLGALGTLARIVDSTETAARIEAIELKLSENENE